MKRIFSNKSGFTLVEIVVAFAVFAIMAGMILSMVQLTVKARTSNTELSLRTEQQTEFLTRYYINEGDDAYVTGEADGEFNLNFIGETCDVSMNYAIRGMETNEAAGINYFVGNTSYDNPAGGGGGGGGLGGGNGSVLGQSQAAQVDTRISGNKNFTYITVKSVEHKKCSACLLSDSCPHNGGELCEHCKANGATSCPHNSGYKYYITVSALGKSKTNGGTVPNEEVPFLQYRLRFYTDTSYKVKITESDGDYNYTYYEKAEIDDYGYIVSTGEIDHGATKTLYDQIAASGQKYYVSQTSSNSVTITAPCGYGKPGYQFENGDGYETSFWVTFKASEGGKTYPFPNLTVNSFGDNGVATPDASDGDAKMFDNKAYKSYSPNIYGAFKYKKEKVS